VCVCVVVCDLSYQRVGEAFARILDATQPLIFDELHDNSVHDDDSDTEPSAVSAHAPAVMQDAPARTHTHVHDDDDDPDAPVFVDTSRAGEDSVNNVYDNQMRGVQVCVCVCVCSCVCSHLCACVC
jgi:hypothetical protein